MGRRLARRWASINLLNTKHKGMNPQKYKMKEYKEIKGLKEKALGGIDAPVYPTRDGAVQYLSYEALFPFNPKP